MACMSKTCLAIDYLYPLSFHEQTETRHTCILFSHGNKIICGFDYVWLNWSVSFQKIRLQEYIKDITESEKKCQHLIITLLTIYI
jgi:hypothetical protein